MIHGGHLYSTSASAATGFAGQQTSRFPGGDRVGVTPSRPEPPLLEAPGLLVVSGGYRAAPATNVATM